MCTGSRFQCIGKSFSVLSGNRVPLYVGDVISAALSMNGFLLHFVWAVIFLFATTSRSVLGPTFQ
jgi:hypothetical protein